MAGDEWLGRILSDKYRLERRLGSEPLGLAYAARQESTGTRHRVLLLRSAGTGDAEIGRIYADRSAATVLRHPRIIRTTDVGVESGQPFVVSDLVEGISLTRWLARRHREAELHIAGWLRDVAAALDWAHQQGIAHLGLQPDSIVIRDGDLVALVGDFGYPIGTLDAPVVSAPEYSAPEQWRRDRALIGPASDVYMVAAILFELVAGQLPFGRGARAMRGHLDRPVPRLQELRPDLESAPQFDRVLNSGLAKSPSERPETVSALVDAFTDVLDKATANRAPRSHHATSVADVSRSRLRVDPILVGGVLIALSLAALWLVGR